MTVCMRYIVKDGGPQQDLEFPENVDISKLAGEIHKRMYPDGVVALAERNSAPHNPPSPPGGAAPAASPVLQVPSDRAAPGSEPAGLFADKPATPQARQQVSEAPAGVHSSPAPSLAVADSPVRPAGANDATIAAQQAGTKVEPHGRATASQDPVRDTEPARAAPKGVRDTSMAAYRALQFSGKLAAQQQRIVDYFLANPKMRFTRKELAHDLGLEINAVCGRVAELLAEPFNVLVEVGKKQCRITRNFVNALQLTQENS